MIYNSDACLTYSLMIAFGQDYSINKKCLQLHLKCCGHDSYYVCSDTVRLISLDFKAVKRQENNLTR